MGKWGDSHHLNTDYCLARDGGKIGNIWDDNDIMTHFTTSNAAEYYQPSVYEEDICERLGRQGVSVMSVDTHPQLLKITI